MKGARALWPAAVLGLAACAGFQDLIALQRGLMAEFQTSSINVTVTTSGHLSVVFQDSVKANLPETERADLARRVAGFVRDHYANYDKIAEVSVGFSQSRRLGPLTSTRTEMPYAFSRTELGPAASPAPAKP